MTFKPIGLAVALSLLVLTPAAAQSVDLAGVRARGLAGAFTAVADDASATWWNPAGLAGGAYVNAILEADRGSDPTDTGGPEGRVTGFAAAFPALGVSYYRFRISDMRAASATAAPPPSRQDQGIAGAGLPALAASQFGVTVGQSVGEHLVLGSTLKVLHGGPEPGGSGSATTTVSLDAGAMATFGAARVALAVRNLTEPTLGAGTVYTLSRQARVGGAVTVGAGHGIDALTVAVDADLTRQATGVDEEQRAIAAGAEAWLWQRRVAVRGGFSAQSVGTRRPGGSAGASVAVRSGLYLEGAVTRGGVNALRGWSAGARVTF